MNGTRALLQGFFDAHYDVDGDPASRLHIGRTAPQVERRFPQAQRFGLITAWNPDAMARDDETNRRAQDELDAQFARRRLRWIEARNAAPDGSWIEPARLVAEIELDDLDRLALHHGQVATLAWTRGEAVRLRMYRPQWRGFAEAARVDTRFVDWVACAPP